MTSIAKASLILIVCFVGITGCKKSDPADKTRGGTTAMKPAMRPVMTSAKMPIHLQEAYACAKAEDCIRTCGQGIVNRAWYKKNESRLQRCKDGCAGPRRLTLKCVNKVCTGFTADGKPDKYGTRHKLRWRTP